MAFYNNVIAGAAGASGSAYEIERSLRLNRDDSAYLLWQPNGAGTSTTKFTLSYWFKMCAPGTGAQHSFMAGTHGNNGFRIRHYNNGQIRAQLYNTSGSLVINLRTVGFFNDPSAWYHLVVAVDTTQATSTDRAKLYINGVEQALEGASVFPPQNEPVVVNSDINHYIGCQRSTNGTPEVHFDGYIAEFHLVDGQTLDQDSFGAVDLDTGVWNPKEYGGTHGTNGSYLEFKDDSSTSALGTDSSANGNNWTNSGLSVSGAATDSLFDSPSLGSQNDDGNGKEVSGNYATWNPLVLHADSNATPSIKNGNLDFNVSNTGYAATVSTLSTGLTGKYYSEITFGGTKVNSNNYAYIGVVPASSLPFTSGSGGADMHRARGAMSISASQGATKAALGDGSSNTFVDLNTTQGYDESDVIGIAIDCDNGQLTFTKNGQSLGEFPYNLDPTEQYLVFAEDWANGSDITKYKLNSGQRAFAHPMKISSLLHGFSDHASYPASKAFDGSTTTLTGAKAFNLAMTWTPFLKNVTSLRIYLDIGSRNETFTVYGNTGTQTHTVTQPFGPDWVTVSLANTGTSVDKILFGPRGTGGQYIDIFAIEVNGTVLTDANTEVGYKAFCTTSLPEPPVVKSSTGFDIATYQGNGSARSISMNTSPDLVWIKDRTQSNYHIWTDSVRGKGKQLYSNTTDLEGSYSDRITSFDANGFSLGTGASGGVNQNNNNYVAWGWDAGDLVTSSTYNQSQTWTNSLTGLGLTGADNAFDGETSSIAQSPNNASANLILTYTFTNVTSLRVYASNPTSNEMRLNNTGSYTAESSLGASSNAGWRTLTSLIPGNGTVTHIEARTTTGSGVNWAAIEVNGKILVNPGIIPAGSLNNASYNTAGWVASTTVSNLYGSHSLSSIFNGVPTGHIHGSQGNTLTLSWAEGTINGHVRVKARKAGTSSNMQYKVHGETSAAPTVVLPNNGNADWYDLGNIDLSHLYAPHPSSGNAVIIHAIELDGKILIDSGQTPPNIPHVSSKVSANPTTGFSVVSYTAAGGTINIGHGLGAKPSFIILKSRNSTGDWLVGHDAFSEIDFLKLNLPQGNSSNASNVFLGTFDDTFLVGDDAGINTNGHQKIAYVWTPIEGFSDFGTYQGNGSASGPFIHTGFRPALVIFKGANSSHWLMMDDARDPVNDLQNHLHPNLSNAEAVASDRCDFLANGFRPRANYGESNSSGIDYLYAAWAQHPLKYARAR
jgi:hypothetical protein